MELIFQGNGESLFNNTTRTLADSENNYLTFNNGSPLLGGQSYFIGKAWCFGELSLSPVVQGNNSPTVNPGIICNGSLLNSASQTDVVMADIGFSAYQHRNNEDFLCNDWNLEGTYVIEFKCLTGCSGTFPHTLNITNHNLVSGNFNGNGFYNPDPSYTWDITGTEDDGIINFSIDYTGLNPSYAVTGQGVIHNDGTLSGTSSSNTGQTFTWKSISGNANEN